MSKIFIVDDDSMMLNVFEKTFRLHGHTISFAKNGEEALRDLSNMAEKPDVVLLDVMMPKMNGFEVLEKIKADPSLVKIPIICLSNLGGDDDIKKAMSLGATLYLIKSQFEPRIVVERTEEVIKKNPK